MPFRGELGNVCDLTVFNLPRVLAQSAVSPVLAGFGLSGVARAASSRLSMMWSHCGIKHGCRVIYIGFSQRRTTVSTQMSFWRHCTCKVTLQGPQSVVCYANNRRKFKKVIGGLGICGIHRGSLNSTKVWLFRSLVVTVTDRVKLGNRRGDSHALTIRWVHVGDPLDVHTHYTTFPLGNVYEYTTIIPSTLTHLPDQ
jgi:hypothetical protein